VLKSGSDFDYNKSEKAIEMGNIEHLKIEDDILVIEKTEADRYSS
jgi:hypothetical protein